MESFTICVINIQKPYRQPYTKITVLERVRRGLSYAVGNVLTLISVSQEQAIILLTT